VNSKNKSIMRTKVQEVRKEAIEKIKKLMGALTHLNMVDIDEGSSPIVCEDKFDSNFTTTLDSIEINPNGILVFYHSSSWENGWLEENDIPTDALLDVAEYLEDNKSIIEEIC
jgi:hypothetical protein